MPKPNRSEGRAIFLDAMAPLVVAQREGYRQGLLKAAEIALQRPDESARSLAAVIQALAQELPRP